ncbi:hypothetical protein Y618_004279 [Salmonella enterica subsp. enterica]|nr:hypothetical protein [Salmonella enterica subsp. enterica serovar Brijbhumi]EDW2284690.1 hypothetical protein [Salmonella enterica subsp. enterica]
MDTVEELNSTYFYAGRSNLTASQLLFMIFCENTANQLGVQDFGAIVSIVAGLNVLPTRTKPRGAIEGTSLASRGSRKVFGTAKILASDVSQIAYRTVRDYNRIARGSDKIW